MCIPLAFVTPWMRCLLCHTLVILLSYPHHSSVTPSSVFSLTFITLVTPLSVFSLTLVTILSHPRQSSLSPLSLFCHTLVSLLFHPQHHSLHSHHCCYFPIVAHNPPSCHTFSCHIPTPPPVTHPQYLQSWRPPFCINWDKLRFNPRLQQINELEVSRSDQMQPKCILTCSEPVWCMIGCQLHLQYYSCIFVCCLSELSKKVDLDQHCTHPGVHQMGTGVCYVLFTPTQPCWLLSAQC